MNAYQRRLDRVEQDMGRECEGGCVKCLLVRIAAEQGGQVRSGCNREPLGLMTILTQLQAEVA